ncbi:MAG: hypothetical protein HY319_20415 [Armatimonadetes bacterium]|nr:hypothetical protein [Armatimonadota bacterium]
MLTVEHFVDEQLGPVRVGDRLQLVLEESALGFVPDTGGCPLALFERAVKSYLRIHGTPQRPHDLIDPLINPGFDSTAVLVTACWNLRALHGQPPVVGSPTLHKTQV